MQELVEKDKLIWRIQSKVRNLFHRSVERIRRILRQFLPWEIVRSLPLRFFVFQDKVDCIFYALSLEKRVTFIQVGANDGINGDSLFEFVLNWNWSGVKIEPVDYIFQRLEENFRSFPNIALEKAAIANENGSKEFYYLEHSEDEPEWYSQLGSFSLPTILKHAHLIPNLQERLITSQVKCLTFNELCDKHQIRAIDVIHIDTEGYDFEVIKLIDFQKLKPGMVLYEHKHLSKTDQIECRQYLENHCYQLIQLQRDTLAISSEFIKYRSLQKAWDLVRK